MDIPLLVSELQHAISLHTQPQVLNQPASPSMPQHAPPPVGFLESQSVLTGESRTALLLRNAHCTLAPLPHGPVLILPPPHTEGIQTLVKSCLPELPEGWRGPPGDQRRLLSSGLLGWGWASFGDKDKHQQESAFCRWPALKGFFFFFSVPDLFFF